MSIQSQAERLKANVAAAYAVAAELGAEMPDAQNSDDLAKTVADAKAVLYKPQMLTDEQQTQARSNIGALAETELDAAVENALAQAKESGDFKGDKGDTGANGVSATHSWNGTTLTITSASGTSSANLKGDKGDTGPQGPQGGTGPTGPTGPAGYTPVRGTDYWTAQDKTQIVSDVLAALPTWNGGSY